MGDVLFIKRNGCLPENRVRRTFVGEHYDFMCICVVRTRMVHTRSLGF
jgi:hypothetical protein